MNSKTCITSPLSPRSINELSDGSMKIKPKPSEVVSHMEDGGKNLKKRKKSFNISRRPTTRSTSKCGKFKHRKSEAFKLVRLHRELKCKSPGRKSGPRPSDKKLYSGLDVESGKTPKACKTVSRYRGVSPGSKTESAMVLARAKNSLMTGEPLDLRFFEHDHYDHKPRGIAARDNIVEGKACAVALEITGYSKEVYHSDIPVSQKPPLPTLFKEIVAAELVCRMGGSYEHYLEYLNGHIWKKAISAV